MQPAPPSPGSKDVPPDDLVVWNLTDLVRLLARQAAAEQHRSNRKDMKP
jgi:hypothetical protein